MKTNNIDALLAGVDLTPDSLQGRSEPLINAPIEPEAPTEIKVPEAPKQEETATPESNSTPEPKESSTDDFGNEIKKTEKDEKNEVIRERLAQQAESLTRRHQLELQQAIEQAKQDAIREFQSQQKTIDSDDVGDWQQELKQFVKETLTETQKEVQERHWKEQAQREQAEFEVKFNTGAAKYDDFEQVVVGKSITPDMVLATKSMQDPAAFLYAAAKTQPQELERISKMIDPYAKAVELGKLEERMRKSRVSTSAPKPIESVRGDMTDKQIKPKSVDDILREEMQERIRARR